MSSRQTRSTRQAATNFKKELNESKVEKKTSTDSSSTQKNEDVSFGSRMTRAASRSKSPANLSESNQAVPSSDVDDISSQKKLKVHSVKKKINEEKGKTDVEQIVLEKKSQSNAANNEEMQGGEDSATESLAGRSTPDLKEFDHYKSKDKSFTSASHVKVIRPLEGETETGRKIYALTVSETSPRTSPKGSMAHASDMQSAYINIEPVADANDMQSAYINIEPEKENLTVYDSTERMEFEDGIVLEINEEEFGNEVSASQESFDSSFGSQEIEKFQNPAFPEADAKTQHPDFEDLPSSQESGISIGSESMYYNKSEEYMDGRIGQFKQETDGQTSDEDDDDDDDYDDDEMGPKSPVTYPSDQSQFFGMFGLVKKTEIPKDDPTKSKLHRAAGGKLRRIVKPRVTSEMVYDNLTIAKSRSIKNIGAVNTGFRVSSSQTIDRSKVPHFKQSGVNSYLKPSQEPSFESKEESIKPSDKKKKSNKVKAPCTRTEKRQESDDYIDEYGNETEVSDSASEEDDFPDSEMIDYMKEESDDSNLEPGLQPALKGYQPPLKVLKLKKTLPKLPITRNSRGKRKEWKHLLKANPDIYEKVSDLEKEQLFFPRSHKGKKDEKGDVKSAEENPVLLLKTKPFTKEELSASKEHSSKPLKLSPKKAKKQRQRDRDKETSKMFDAVDSSKSYLDLYEEVMENQSGSHYKKRKKKDWALAKMLLDEATELKRVKEKGLNAPALMDVQSKNGQKASSPSKRKRDSSPQKGQHKSPMKEGVTIKEEPLEEGEFDESNVLGQLKVIGLVKEVDFNKNKQPSEPDNFMAILKQRKEKEIKEEDESLLSPRQSQVPLVIPKYGNQAKEDYGCMTPHMCDVCWVNDHMYSRNTKRKKNGLANGGCLHNAPCKHYSQSAIQEAEKLKKLKSVKRALVVEVPILKVENDPTMEYDDVDIEGMDESMQTSERESELELGCDEEMYHSDSESRPVEGTEILIAQLNAREQQIKDSLGISEDEELPSSNGVIEFAQRKDTTKNKDCHILWSTHAAEIIVATENTWYYPPKHLSILYDKDQGVPLSGFNKNVYSQNRTVLTRTAIPPGIDGKGKTTRVQIKVMPPVMSDEKLIGTTESTSDPQKTQKVIKVRVHKLDKKKILIQQIVGEEEETVVKETLLNVDDDVIKEVSSGCSRAWPNNRRNQNSILGDIIAREALKLVQTPRPHPSKQNLCMKVSSDSATIKVVDVGMLEADDMFSKEIFPKPKKKKIICKKDPEIEPIVKEKGVNLYGFPQVAWEIVKDTVSNSRDVEEITNTVKENINKFYGDDKLCSEQGEKTSFVEHPVLHTSTSKVSTGTSKSILKVTPDIRIMSFPQGAMEGSTSLLQDPRNKEQLKQKYEFHKQQKNKPATTDLSGQTVTEVDSTNTESADVQKLGENDEAGMPRYILKPKGMSYHVPKLGSEPAEDAISNANKLLKEIEVLKEKRNKELRALGGEICLDAVGDDEADDDDISDERHKNFQMVHNVLVSTAEALKEINQRNVHFKTEALYAKMARINKNFPAMLEQWSLEGKEPALKDFPSTGRDNLPESRRRSSSTEEIKEITAETNKMNKIKDVIPIKVNSLVPMNPPPTSTVTTSTAASGSKAKPLSGDGNSQTLTFTTKDIREKRPELIEYIKKASLAPVICAKLNTEKCSLNNMLVKVDALFTKLKAELEQKKCLLAAVRSEKYWLEDRQKSFSSKIMTAVDQSIKVSNHLKSVLKSKKRLQQSLINCSRIQQDAKLEASTYRESQDWFIRNLKPPQETSKHKKIWVLNDEGKYEKQVLQSKEIPIKNENINPRITDYWAARNSTKGLFKILETSSSIDKPSEKLNTDSDVDWQIKVRRGSRRRNQTVKELLEESRKSNASSLVASPSTSPLSFEGLKGLVDIAGDKDKPISINDSEDNESTHSMASEYDNSIMIVKAPKPKTFFSISKSVLEPKYQKKMVGASKQKSDLKVVLPMKNSNSYINRLFEKGKRKMAADKAKIDLKKEDSGIELIRKQKLLSSNSTSVTDSISAFTKANTSKTHTATSSGVPKDQSKKLIKISPSVFAKLPGAQSKTSSDGKLSIIVPSSSLNKVALAQVHSSSLPVSSGVTQTLRFNQQESKEVEKTDCDKIKEKGSNVPLNVTYFKPSWTTSANNPPKTVVIMSPASFGSPCDTSTSTTDSSEYELPKTRSSAKSVDNSTSSSSLATEFGKQAIHPRVKKILMIGKRKNDTEGESTTEVASTAKLTKVNDAKVDSDTTSRESPTESVLISEQILVGDSNLDSDMTPKESQLASVITSKLREVDDSKSDLDTTSKESPTESVLISEQSKVCDSKLDSDTTPKKSKPGSIKTSKQRKVGDSKLESETISKETPNESKKTSKRRKVDDSKLDSDTTSKETPTKSKKTLKKRKVNDVKGGSDKTSKESPTESMTTSKKKNMDDAKGKLDTKKTEPFVKLLQLNVSKMEQTSDSIVSKSKKALRSKNKADKVKTDKDSVDKGESSSADQESWSDLTFDQLESILDESDIPDSTVEQFML